MKYLRQIHNCLAFSSLRSEKTPLHLPFGGIWVQNCWKGLNLPTKCCAPDKQNFWKLGEIPYSCLARNTCMWLCILSHSQPKLHFYISFLLFPNATFRPGTSRRRPYSLCMDVCQNKIGQCNQHKRLVFIYLSGWENMSCVWKHSDTVEKENGGGFVLFSKRDGRTAVVKAAGILPLGFYYAPPLYWPPKNDSSAVVVYTEFSHVFTRSEWFGSIRSKNVVTKACPQLQVTLWMLHDLKCCGSHFLI